MPTPSLATSATAEGLGEFIDASPSPFHVCATVAAELESAGFQRLFEDQDWSTEESDAFEGFVDDAGRRFYVIRGGSIIAWDLGDGDGFRIVGGHTDSPNLRLKQNPDRESAGLATVALEPYGGAWLNSWLDRDLGLSGRLAYRADSGVSSVLVNVTEPVLRVPQLAIHLSEDRKGVTLNPQRHVDAIWGVDAATPILQWVAEYAGIDADALQNQSATAVAQVFSASQMRIKLIARIMAEGVRDMFALLHGTIRKHGQQQQTVRMRNAWVTVDPRNWKTRDDMTINVGLGTGGKAQQFAQVMALANVQKELIGGGKVNMVGDRELLRRGRRADPHQGAKEPKQVPQ